MNELKIILGLAIIIASFVYILKNKGSLLDNLLKKTKEDYEKQQVIKEKASELINGNPKVIDDITNIVKNKEKNIKKSLKQSQNDRDNK